MCSIASEDETDVLLQKKVKRSPAHQSSMLVYMRNGVTNNYLGLFFVI